MALGTDYNTSMQAGMPVGEMEMLLAAGLTTMEVIEAGTRHSAYVCGQCGELGTLEPGMLADVVVVDGDPLESLQAMRGNLRPLTYDFQATRFLAALRSSVPGSR